MQDRKKEPLEFNSIEELETQMDVLFSQVLALQEGLEENIQLLMSVKHAVRMMRVKGAVKV